MRMNPEKNKFYVTTPIYYVTAKPHLGHLYSTVIADVLARWHKLKNESVFFLTGTDEFGQKIAQAAAKAGKEPQEFVDSFIDAYKTVWHDYEIDYSIFMRTTDEFHIKAVQKWILQLMQRVISINHSMRGGIAPIVKHLLLNMMHLHKLPIALHAVEKLKRFQKKPIFLNFQHIKISYYNFMKKIPTLLCQKNVHMKLLILLKRA